MVDCKVGDRIRCNRDLTGVVLFHGKDGNPNYGEDDILIQLDPIPPGIGWSANPMNVSFHTSIASIIADKVGLYWTLAKYVKEVLAPTTTIAKTNKSDGGHCTICNEYNPWQDGPYTCWSHNH